MSYISALSSVIIIMANQSIKEIFRSFGNLLHTQWVASLGEMLINTSAFVIANNLIN